MASDLVVRWCQVKCRGSDQQRGLVRSTRRSTSRIFDPQGIGGLVDEYVLAIQPVSFGSRLPLFADLPDALRLELVEAKTFDSTVLHIYRPSDRASRPRA